jgi:hypothetical protein
MLCFQHEQRGYIPLKHFGNIISNSTFLVFQLRNSLTSHTEKIGGPRVAYQLHKTVPVTKSDRRWVFQMSPCDNLCYQATKSHPLPVYLKAISLWNVEHFSYPNSGVHQCTPHPQIALLFQFLSSYIDALSTTQVTQWWPCALTKHHAMEAYWGSGCIAPLILWPRH